MIVGLGHLGHALARSQGFAGGGFRLVGLFDNDPSTVGEEVGGQLVRHICELAEVCRQEEVAVGIVTTPAAAAQEVADFLAAGGVSAILNFAPAVISVPPRVQVRHVDFSAELQVLAFYQAHPETVATRDAAAAWRDAHSRRPHDGAVAFEPSSGTDSANGAASRPVAP